MSGLIAKLVMSQANTKPLLMSPLFIASGWPTGGKQWCAMDQVPSEVWQRVTAFFAAYVPRLQLDVHALTLMDWTKAVRWRSLLKVLTPFTMNNTSSLVLGGHIDDMQHWVLLVEDLEPHHIGLDNLVES